MDISFNKIQMNDLEPGDHIYSWRQAYIYAHHGIYVGDGIVIHFTQGAGQKGGTGTFFSSHSGTGTVSSSRSGGRPCQVCGDQTMSSGVISSCIYCFLCGGDLYRFLYNVTIDFLVKTRAGTCTVAASDQPADVLHRAKYLLENGFGDYDIFKNNCENFAVYCKTGLVVVTDNSAGYSGQAGSVLPAATAIVCLPAAASMSLLQRMLLDIGVRRDVAKVPVEKLVLDQPKRHRAATCALM